MKSSARVVVLLVTAAVVLSACFGANAKKDPKPAKYLTASDIEVGMSLEDFRAIFSEFSVPSDEQWTRPGEIQGLRGEWTYSFRDHHLSWFIFNSYSSEVNAGNFKAYMDATQKTVASYSRRYGKPDQVVRGVLQFKDPREGYPGYPVLRASWKMRNENLQVDYLVLGNTGERPQLLFTVEARR